MPSTNSTTMSSISIKPPQLSDSKPAAHITSMPAEFLDKVFEILGPGLHNDSSDNLIRFNRNPPPSDLLRCRLACRLFYHSTSRWVWRLVNMEFSSPHSKIATHIFEICALVRSRHEIGRHIRFLNLFLHVVDPSIYEALLTIIPILTKLRLLRIHAYGLETTGGLPPNIASDLFSKPSLDTVVLVGGDYRSSLSSLDTEPKYAIKHLHVETAFQGEMYSLARLPSLESLSWVDSKNSGTYPLDIPWSSLKEFSFLGQPSVVKSFQSWKKSAVSRPSPLTELIIYDRHGSKININKMLKIFEGQPLTKLDLVYIDKITVPQLQKIVAAFPALRELTLVDDGFPRWCGDTATYFPVLGQLNDLASLGWFGTASHQSHQFCQELALFARMLSRYYCLNVRRVKFCMPKLPMFEAIEFVVANGNVTDGIHNGHAIPIWEPYTSAWQNSRFADL